MAPALLDLPTEIRLSIYDHVFTNRLVIVDAGTQENCASLLPTKAAIQRSETCSGQILRVCKKMNRETESFLYSRTRFCVLAQAFAGKLPSTFSSNVVHAPKIRHLTWQLNCDMMKHFYDDEMKISPDDLNQLDSLELRCQAENWKGSFCGEWTDREAFVRGRSQIVKYAQELQRMMNQACTAHAVLIENRVGLSRGRVVVRLTRTHQTLSEDELIID